MNNKKESAVNTSAAEELQKAKLAAQQMQVIAQEAVNRMNVIESSLSPQLLRKPSIFTLLFHWREVVKAIGEVIRIIKEFKEALQRPPQEAQTNAAN